MGRVKIVLDLEFIPIRSKTKTAPSLSEIIEIGAVALDENNQQLDTFQTYVKPQHRKIPQRITDITKITNEMVADAPDFEAATELFEHWIAGFEPCRFYTWSGTDQPVYLREADWKEVTLSRVFHCHWVDLQRLHQRLYHLMRPWTLVNALGTMRTDFEGIEHGALADAKNTAEILRQLSDVRAVCAERKESQVTFNQSAGSSGFRLQFSFKK